MRRAIVTSAVVVCLGWVPSVSAQGKPVHDAFDHYEQIRIALATDTLSDVAAHAKALAPLVGTLGGATATSAVEQLGKAKTLDDARANFGDLSAALVPKFQAEGIPGAHAYMCPMKQKPWMQRGEKMGNPYFGKSMLTCGSPLEAKGK